MSALQNLVTKFRIFRNRPNRQTDGCFLSSWAMYWSSATSSGIYLLNSWHLEPWKTPPCSRPWKCSEVPL